MDLPAETQIRWILRTTATLLEYGAEPVRGLVQPSAEFFPDVFDGSPKAVEAVLARVQEHAGLADVPVQLAVVAPDGEVKTSGCSSGACGKGIALGEKLERATQLPDGAYRVAVSVGEVMNAVALTTAFVRAVSFMFLTESDAMKALPRPDREPAVDLAAVLLGFGVLAANGSYIYAKGCGGVQVHSATRMPVDEVTLALAIFCKLHQIPDRLAEKHLQVTPRAHFEESAVWAASNAQLVRMLREDRARVAADDYAIGESRSWLARALGIGKKRARGADDDLAALERALPADAKTGAKDRERKIDPERAAKLAELRSLVDESLGS